MSLLQRGINFVSRSTNIYLKHLGCRCGSDYSGHQSSKFMQKLLNKRGGKGKRKWYGPHVGEPTELKGSLHKLNKHGVTEADRTRARQLSHVLFDRISHIVNSGELSDEILNKQVFITTVKMNTDFSGVNIYWDSSRTDAPEIETLLHAHSGKLRSLLISYHVLGRIPPLTFVKDKSLRDLGRIYQLLEVADYGPDYIPGRPHAKTGNTDQSGRWDWSKQDPTAMANSNTDSGKPGSVEFSIAQPSPVAETSSSLPKVPDGVDCNDATAQDAVPDNQDNEKSEETALNVSDLGLNFRSNLYGLPREDLLRKVIAHKTKTKFQGRDESKSLEVKSFDVKHLKSQMDKKKLKSMRDSSRAKQRLLDMDFEDVRDTMSSKDKGIVNWREEVEEGESGEDFPDDYEYDSESEDDHRR